jgi:hypothetical protein
VRERLHDLTALRISGLKEEAELHTLVAQAKDWEAAVTTAFTTAEQQPTDSDIQQLFESGKAVLASPLMFEALRWRVDTAAALRAVDAATAAAAGAATAGDGAATAATTTAGHNVSTLQELVARGTSLLSSATDSSSSASSSAEQQSAATAAASAAVAAVVQAAVTPALQGLEVALWRVTAAEALTADSDDTSLAQAEQLLQRAAAAALASTATATTAAASPEYAALAAAVQEKRTAEAAAAAALQRALSVSVGIVSEEGAHELDTAAGVLKQALQQFRSVHEQLRSDVEDW